MNYLAIFEYKILPYYEKNTFICYNRFYAFCSFL